MNRRDDQESTATFHISGRIDHVGPAEFVVIATAVPDNGNPSEIRSITEDQPSLACAQRALEALVMKVGAIVHKTGGTVSDVETYGL
jgi:hypothetical protein